MKLQGAELRQLEMPLVAPFQTSFGVATVKHAVIVRAVTDMGDGWGESVAMEAPTYSAEYSAGVVDVMRRFLLPALFEAGTLSAAEVAARLAGTRGHPMAKAALEMAVLDAELRAQGVSLASHLGATRTRVPSGVSVGIAPSIDALLGQVGGFLDEGYVRIKLKIQPGWDVQPVRAVRERFGDETLLQVDANAAYHRDDVDALRDLDPFNLLLVEQPLPEEDLLGHADLAKQIKTPVCLDESVISAQTAAAAIALGACSVVNIKPGRVGGYLEARRVHDVCVANGVAAWCGGMLETGIGRAANIAFAALPGCTLPGDVSASGRFYTRDITPPWTLVDGGIDVPTGPGIGVDPIADELDAVTVSKEWIARPT